MTAERIFVTRYEQLGRLINTRNQAELLDLPVILRQLLVDGTPLVHQVNRTHRIRLRFTLGLSARQCSAEMATLGVPVPSVHLLAVLRPNEPRREVDLEQLLKHEVVKIGKNYYSAHQLLHACANKLGGVHYDPKGSDHEIVRELSALGEFLERMGSGSAFATLLLLARVAHAGLSPLYEAAKKASL